MISKQLSGLRCSRAPAAGLEAELPRTAFSWRGFSVCQEDTFQYSIWRIRDEASAGSNILQGDRELCLELTARVGFPCNRHHLFTQKNLCWVVGMKTHRARKAGSKIDAGIVLYGRYVFFQFARWRYPERCSLRSRGDRPPAAKAASA
jgi:hypothetical protein